MIGIIRKLSKVNLHLSMKFKNVRTKPKKNQFCYYIKASSFKNWTKQQVTKN